MSDIEVKLRNWFKYSVIYTCAPFLFALILSIIIGYPKSELDIFPDLILTVFSIGVNVASYISDLVKDDNKQNRVVYVKDACEISLLFFIVLYFGVFNFDFTQNLIFDSEESANQALIIVYWITWGIGFLYALSIAAIEIIRNRGKK